MSKANITKKANQSKQTNSGLLKPFLTLGGILLLVLVAMASLHLYLKGRQANQEQKIVSVPMTGVKDVRGLVEGLLVQVNPVNPENNYMPAYMKEKLKWLILQQKAGTLSITGWSGGKPFNPSTDSGVIMKARNDGGQKKIMVNGEMVWYFWQQVQNGQRTWENLKNSFAIALTHEGVHLELLSRTDETFEEHTREEARAWSTVSWNVVRPLRAMGQPMQLSYIKVDDILLGCNDDINCEAFRQAVTPKARTRAAP